MHQNAAKEIKGKHAPSNHDMDLTFAMSSSETASASSEHERDNIYIGKQTSSGN